MNEQYNQGSSVFPDMQQRSLPNSTAVLILGILSIAGCCFIYGFASLAMAVIALYLAAKDRKLYRMNPNSYTQGSYKNVNAGRICAIIGLVLAALFIMFFLAIIAMFGYEVISDPEAAKEAAERFLEQYQ
jgi:M penetrans paralogue family 26